MTSSVLDWFKHLIRPIFCAALTAFLAGCSTKRLTTVEVPARPLTIENYKAAVLVTSDKLSPRIELKLQSPFAQVQPERVLRANTAWLASVDKRTGEAVVTLGVSLTHRRSSWMNLNRGSYLAADGVAKSATVRGRMVNVDCDGRGCTHDESALMVFTVAELKAIAAFATLAGTGGQWQSRFSGTGGQYDVILPVEMVAAFVAAVEEQVALVVRSR